MDIGDANIPAVAALFADKTRSAFLDILLERHALTAGELARAAKVSPSVASMHLSKLVEGGLVTVEKSGRHRYYRLSEPTVARAMATLALLAQPKPVRSLRESEQVKALRFARTCYDHLAGALGVRLAETLVMKSWTVEDCGRFVVTPEGEKHLASFGIDIADLRKQRRLFASKCLDWSERRHHIGGSLGAAILRRLQELEWITRHASGRGVRVTEEGWRGLGTVFGIRSDDLLE
jgi:DNA-binding transcriptional ArsR family regulator